MNANSGRGQLFRRYLTGRFAVWGAVIGAAIAFAIGAWRDDVLIMAAGPVAVALAVAAIAWLAADRSAERRFHRGFAKSLGLAYVPQIEVLALTPLLGAGSRRRMEHWMHGSLPGGLPGGLGQLVWERVQRDNDGDEAVRERNRFTVCVVDLEASLLLFRGVFVHPRRGLLPAYSDWLEGDARTVEVESTEFTERYELRISSDQDEVRMRRLLSPTLVSWLAKHPLTPGVEIKAGALCVFVPRAIEDAANLTYLLDATRHLAGRLVAEVMEEAGRRSATGPPRAEAPPPH